jgi:FKBP-type peptidyl-prolyl cis-trans isomerase FklB
MIMTKTLPSALCLILVLTTGMALGEEKQFETPEARISYGLGHSIGSNVKLQYDKVDPDALFKGIRDGLDGADMKVSEEQVAKDIAAYQQERAGEAKARGEKFLAENEKKKGVTVLPSGLQYEVLVKGKGKKPETSGSVKVNYRGTLLDGTEFDSSYKRGGPATFPVSGVIMGMSEALLLMEEGAKWKLYIPPGLAYGERGAGSFIGPNETLIFELELVEVL